MTEACRADVLEAVDWSGNATTFTQSTSTPQAGVNLYGCSLSPDGSRMACTANSNRVLTFLESDGTTVSTGHEYQNILGWIDSTHLLVDVDSDNLGVLDADTGILTTLPVPQANEISMVATLPGSL
jgi:hypothetical protein